MEGLKIPQNRTLFGDHVLGGGGGYLQPGLRLDH